MDPFAKISNNLMPSAILQKGHFRCLPGFEYVSGIFKKIANYSFWHVLLGIENCPLKS